MITLKNGGGIWIRRLDGNEELKPLGYVENIELSSVNEDKTKYFNHNSEMTFSVDPRCDLRALALYLITGNPLYYRCPKKIKRSRKWRSIIRDMNRRIGL